MLFTLNKLEMPWVALAQRKQCSALTGSGNSILLQASQSWSDMGSEAFAKSGLIMFTAASLYKEEGNRRQERAELSKRYAVWWIKWIGKHSSP